MVNYPIRGGEDGEIFRDNSVQILFKRSGPMGVLLRSRALSTEVASAGLAAKVSDCISYIVYFILLEGNRLRDLLRKLRRIKSYGASGRFALSF